MTVNYLTLIFGRSLGPAGLGDLNQDGARLWDHVTTEEDIRAGMTRILCLGSMLYMDPMTGWLSVVQHLQHNDSNDAGVVRRPNVSNF
jgi:hypothetical protein